MAHESSRSRPSSSKVSPIDGEVPSSPVIRLNRLKGNYFGQSVIDFDLDEEYTSKLLIVINNQWFIESLCCL